jgi:hypothetical protein
MNIAEGKGRFSKKEFVQFLYISRGSLYETMTLLEILQRRNWISNEHYSSLEPSASWLPILPGESLSLDRESIPLPHLKWSGKVRSSLTKVIPGPRFLEICVICG